MTHIMVDLETLSTEPTARIVAIGAVKFDPELSVYDRYYQAIFSPEINALMQSHIDDDGFHISNDTLSWWLKQNEEARKVFTDHFAVNIDTALKTFNRWVLADELTESVRMWGNGASFDNVILSEAYRIRKLERPWMFWNDRCYRTVKALHPDVPFERSGTHHNALDDAESQALHLLNMNVTIT